MICVSIGSGRVKVIRSMTNHHECAELRLDLMKPKLNEVPALMKIRPKVIVTCRPGKWNDRTRLKYLATAIEHGAAFVDIEIDSSSSFRKAITRIARAHRCKIISSYHNFRTTPDAGRLKKIVARALGTGSDLVKIACRVSSMNQNAILLGLYENRTWRGRLIVTGMGEAGRMTRIVAPLIGSPIAYVSPGKGGETAKGQLTSRKLQKTWKSMGLSQWTISP